MRITRRGEHNDLLSLLEVYRHLNPAMPVLADEQLRNIWAETLSSKDTALFVSLLDGRVVSTCLLVTGPNLMRGGAPHALLENVATHRDQLRQGHGRATIGFALNEAWGQGLPSCVSGHRPRSRQSLCARLLRKLRIRDG